MQRCEAWLYGKGYSLDTHDFRRDGRPRFAINEAGLVVPLVDRVFAQDPQVLRLLSSAPGGLSVCNILEVSPPVPAVATAPAAIVILARADSDRIFLIGFDSYFGKPIPKDALPDGERGERAYARCVEEAVGHPLHRGNGSDYADINEQIRQAAFWYGVELVDGTMFDR